MLMKVKLQQIGNSMMVTIPKVMQQEANLKVGDTVVISRKRKVLVLEKEKNGVKKFGQRTGLFSVPDFDFDEFMKLIKEGIYER